MLKGISTHVFIKEILSLDHLESIRSCGFERLEIFAVKPHFNYQDSKLSSSFASWLADHGHFLHSIHTPFCLDYQARGDRGWLSIAEPEKTRRTQAVDEIRRALEFAEKVSVPFAIIHMGGLSDTYSLKHLDAVYYSLETLLSFASDRGVRLALENIPNELSEIEKMLRFLQDARFDDVGICFDSGHSNLMAHPPTEIETGGSRIVTTHLHDNHGKTDEHLFPFNGNIKWEEVLEAFDKTHYTGCMLLELEAADRDPGEKLKSAYQVFDRFSRCMEELEEARAREG